MAPSFSIDFGFVPYLLCPAKCSPVRRTGLEIRRIFMDTGFLDNAER
jgi:hypothetical protein